MTPGLFDVTATLHVCQYSDSLQPKSAYKILVMFEVKEFGCIPHNCFVKQIVGTNRIRCLYSHLLAQGIM
jgi:hypothetical protein